MDLPPDSSVLDPDYQALQRLISRTVPRGELASLIGTIFSNKKVVYIVDRLQDGDVQTFIDVIDEALDDLDFSLQIRKRCVRLLYKICAARSLLPKSLKIEVHYNLSDVPHCRGGFADVWKGTCSDQTYGDRKAAVKVLRISVDSDLKKITPGFCKEFLTWKSLKHPNVLPLLGVEMTEMRFAMVSEWMTNGNVNQFVAAHPNADRFGLLADAARGLIYMHGQGMIHGDLKGANILVDQTYHARLADFGLLTILSDSGTTASFVSGGTTRWMAPELFDHEIQNSSPTKNSDCYSLGMVIYEILSGHVPFYQFQSLVVPGIIFSGKRPGRPQGSKGVWFTDDVWAVSEHCWAHKPDDRPGIKDVLRCLEEASRVWTPHSTRVVPSPTTPGPPTHSIFGIRTEQSADWGDVSSPFQAATFLRKVAEWDGNSPNIDQVLTAAFEADDYLDCVNDLEAQNVDPLLYINSLDKIIDSLPADSSLRRRCIRALRKTCGLHGILPTSHNVSLALTKLGKRHFTTGGSADVWKFANGNNHDQVFAVKSFRMHEHNPVEKIDKKFCKDVIVCKRMDHPNILTIEGVAPSLFPFCMVSRWMPNENMVKYVAKHTEVNRLELLIGITRGLDYLHRNGVIHGNLKGPNILIDANGNPRLSGFSCCSITENIESVNASTLYLGGAVRYCAPERFGAGWAVGQEKGRPTKKSDVYSLSMVMVELATGRAPFPEWPDHKVPTLVLKGKRPSELRRLNKKTLVVWKIAERCWHQEAKERPEVDVVLKDLKDLSLKHPR